MMKLVKTEIQLLPLSLERAKDYLRWFNNPKVNKYLLTTTPKTKAQIVNWIDKTLKDKSCLYFSIYLPKQELFVGHIGLKEIDLFKKQAEIGVVIGERDYWRKGIGTVAFKKILEEIKRLCLKKLIAMVCKNNTPSIKFFTNLGFKPMATKEEDSVILVYHL